MQWFMKFEIHFLLFAPVSEVSTLSGQVLNLYPPDYKEAFAFSNMLYPLDHSTRLLDSYRYTSESIGLTKFRLTDFQQLF